MLYYEFQVIANSDLDPTTYVYSDKKEIVELFLNQHHFHENAKYQITCIDKSCGNGKYELLPHRFKSNTSNEEIIIYTTEDIITNILEITYSELENAYMFNKDAIMHCDHECIRLMNDMIYQLPFACVLNFINFYEGMDEEIYQYNAKYIKVFSSTNSKDYSSYPDLGYQDFDDFNTYLNQALGFDYDQRIKNDEVMTLTIESYISGFIKTLS